MRIGASLIILIVLTVFASTVSAIPIGVVGGADDLIHWGVVPDSGQDSEAQWVADYLGVGVEEITYTKVPDPFGEGDNWMEVEGDGADENLWAFDFGHDNAELFVIKTGRVELADGSCDSCRHFLYNNLIALQYGVIDLYDFERNGRDIEISKVSHIGTSVGTPVPEPSTVFLLGTSMIGVFGFRKKIRKNQ